MILCSFPPSNASGSSTSCSSHHLLSPSRLLQGTRNFQISAIFLVLILLNAFPTPSAWRAPPLPRLASPFRPMYTRVQRPFIPPISNALPDDDFQPEREKPPTYPRPWPPFTAEEEEGVEEKEAAGEGGHYYIIEEEERVMMRREVIVVEGTEPHPRRARFELHKRWQSVTSVDVVEDGQILGGTKKGLPEQTLLRWQESPRNVLLLMKRGSHDILQRVADITNFLQAREGVRVLVERQVKYDLLDSFDIHVAELYGARDRSHHAVDLVITLGGDGLLMHANWLFQKSAPIILPVNLGSLGFLLPFEYDDIYPTIERVLTQDVDLTMRMRLRCRIIRNETVVMDLVVMNDAVVERGSSPYLASLDCFCNGQYVTTVQADGLIIATPTGSTAYSMSAGGSMMHPGIQALLLTPICPHSLSFRPLVFPDSAVISLCMPLDVRSHAWVSFDGRFRHRLMDGDILEVSNSEYPLPTVTHRNVTADWFRALNKAFNFNMRTRQKPL
ncbi:hypothetical protein NSK_007511 [Nannochloropsis salina CCMP1776]|uniref:NAD(+) kinase n=1 Tax=Nannochloropsis salina CCMP1776 TaxID=1027361 RepID=A0A4D9CX60_9STRA|nr:hypothetical protein NSK_007511 [Nannochloropsis salina CCMP1776]|eukprot:TFJ81169.1 hypothetical protein NSK_007511 [Nannochloropsis salina CCMP1776]